MKQDSKVIFITDKVSYNPYFLFCFLIHSQYLLCQCVCVRRFFCFPCSPLYYTTPKHPCTAEKRNFPAGTDTPAHVSPEVNLPLPGVFPRSFVPHAAARLFFSDTNRLSARMIPCANASMIAKIRDICSSSLLLVFAAGEHLREAQHQQHHADSDYRPVHCITSLPPAGLCGRTCSASSPAAAWLLWL